MNFTLTYHSKSPEDPDGGAPIIPFGPNWNFNWIGYIERLNYGPRSLSE